MSNDGGAVANLPSSQLKSNLEVGGGAHINAYEVDWSYDGPSKASGYQIGTGSDDKYIRVSLIDQSQSSCSVCSSTDASQGPNLLWPGMGMTAEKENNGWWKIEVPLIVKPDIALVMFANGHSNTGTKESDKRYPINQVPGIPLPNYSDREAWYLYDYALRGENCSFSDDRRESYPQEKFPTPVNGESLPFYRKGNYYIKFSGTFRIWMWTDSENVSDDTNDWTYPGNDCTNSLSFKMSKTHGSSEKLTIRFIWPYGDNDEERKKNYGETSISPSSFKWNASNNRWEATVTIPTISYHN